jgi:hypothetical protein
MEIQIGPPAWLEWENVRWYRNRAGYYQDRTGTLMHTAIWERLNHRKVPDGYVVHHKDENKGNNDLSNLELMSFEEHARMHCKARPADHPWVKQQGSEQMRKRVTKLWENRKPRDVTCVGCGKVYQSIGMRSKFCDRACAARYYRSVGRAQWAG